MAGTYFFSFRSPYSWLASLALKDRIEASSARDALTLVPFWEPDAVSRATLDAHGGEFPYRAMSDAKHRYILKDIKRLATARGIPMTWPVDPAPWWEPSHLGWIAANEVGYGLPFFWEVYAARWQDGLNISDTQVIEHVALRTKMPQAEASFIARATSDPDIRAKAAEYLHKIWMKDVFGVPMFVAGREQFWGLDRLDEFIDYLDAGGRRRETPPPALKPGTGAAAIDFDHAGGCG